LQGQARSPVLRAPHRRQQALLRDQRKFSEDVIKATSPLLPGDSKGMPAPRTPAQKASAK